MEINQEVVPLASIGNDEPKIDQENEIEEAKSPLAKLIVAFIEFVMSF